MIEKMDSVVNAISNFLYSGPEKLPIPFVIVFLICGGLYFTIRSKACLLYTSPSPRDS